MKRSILHVVERQMKNASPIGLAPGETVAIKGSEVVTGWEPVSSNVWKYLFGRSETGLYNLKNDIAETTNLKDQYPEKFQALEKLYNAWFAQMAEPAKGTKFYEPKGCGK